MRKPLARKYDFKEIEKEIELFWKRNKLVAKTIQYEPSKPLFSWLEGPPTANAPPGLHHVEVRVFKDLNLRLKYMQGFTVPRKGGWDCHGLPVEVQVEKKLNLPSKKDVVNYGIDKFTKMCRQDVFSYIKDWERLTDKMAFWEDLENPYVTMENDYIESVWWSLKELYEKGLLYEGHKVVPYCPRCETPLSSHEVALGYKEVSDPAITVKFKLKDKNRYVLAWTTTPWTLPSNVALAVNPNITYAVVKHKGDEYVLAKELAAKYFESPEISEEFEGTELVGLSYEPLFGYFQSKLNPERSYKILPADFVAISEGTGVVHLAPAFGEDDYAVVQKSNFEFLQPVTESGKFTEEVKDFQGKFVKDCDPAIIEFLENKGLVLNKEKYLHNYPFCWRCSTPLLYYATKSWFIKVSAYRDRLLANNEKINWYPDHIKHGRFGNWLEGVKDWALSRKKFWGTPLPIWKCECGVEKAIGSVKELKELAVKMPGKLDLHKPHIDKIQLKCDCGKKMTRIEDVIDCWYDSGAAPFAQLHYPFENKELFEKNFPYDFITEAIDQTRGWFYTMHALSTLLFDSPAYKSCLVAGHVLDDKGEKMSKSKGNIINPWEAFDKVGVDAVRLHFLTTSPEDPKRFGYESLNESTVPFLILLWNTAYYISEFYQTQNLDGKEEAKLRVEDEWMISATNRMVETVTKELAQHNYNIAVAAIKTCIMDDLSRWYIKLVRDRTQKEDKAVAYTFRYCLERLVRVLAPLIPYTAEKLFREFELGTSQSVHLTLWPVVEQRNEALEKQMAAAQSIVGTALSCRDKAAIGVRWPLSELFVETKNKEVAEAAKKLSALISEQVNVKQIIIGEKYPQAKLLVKADLGKLGPVFAKKTPMVVAHLATQGQDVVARNIDEKGEYTFNLDGEKITILKEHVTISRELPQDVVLSQFSEGIVYLNTKSNPELEAEGVARELARRIQELRKKAGLEKKDRIQAFVMLENPRIIGVELKKELKEKIGAEKLELSVDKPQKNYPHRSEEKIKHYPAIIFLKKI
ncbi:MAG: isoleucine--tRNA ligase [Nanoarchaeota archaeon]